MAEDVIRPSEGLKVISDAELTIVERIRFLSTKVIEVLDELREMFVDAMNMRFEAIRARYERCKGWFRDFRTIYSEARRHFLRVEPAIPSRGIYDRIYEAFRRLSKFVLMLSLDLALYSKGIQSLGDELNVAIQRVFEHVKAAFGSVASASMILFDYRTKALEEIDHGMKSLENAQEVLEDVALRCKATNEFMNIVEKISDLIEECFIILNELRFLAERG